MHGGRLFDAAGGSLTFVIDETLGRRWGRRINKRGHYRDPLASSRKRSVSTSGLHQLLENDNSRFLARALVGRVRNLLTVLFLSEHIDEFVAQAPPGWRVHRLSGGRRNEWRVSVSGNWRITFEENEGRISRLNLEDYH